MDDGVTLVDMLRCRRPSRSRSERRFIQQYISGLDGAKHDRFGNRIVRIGDAPVMYSCHTDSVHKDGGIQDLTLSDKMVLRLHSKSKSNCLGADNAAGVWIMRELILAKKPGLYIFHREEESGGRGSRYIAKHTPEVVKDIKVAIAFDRRDTKSIITHQLGGRSCSDAFGESLANELHLKHKLDSGGTFTDTASYTDLIPECTNVSVGFDWEHSSRELLDTKYLFELRASMLELNWEQLVIKRKAGEYEPRYYHKPYYRGDKDMSYGNYWGREAEFYTGYGHDKQDDESWNDYYRRRKAERAEAAKKYQKQLDKKWRRFTKGKWDIKDTKLLTHQPKEVGFVPNKKKEPLLPDGYEQGELKFGRGWSESNNDSHMLTMVTQNPSLAVHLLKDHGVDADELAEFVSTYGGVIPCEMYLNREDR